MTIRVRYPEVDAMGYLHHSRYFQYFEMGRVELLRSLGHAYADLERSGVLETRRGVGSFIAATPKQAHPPREHDRRLRVFITRLLSEADSAGLTLDDVLGALAAHKKGELR